jgi:hypothetical protein
MKIFSKMSITLLHLISGIEAFAALPEMCGNDEMECTFAEGEWYFFPAPSALLHSLPFL